MQRDLDRLAPTFRAELEGTLRDDDGTGVFGSGDVLPDSIAIDVSNSGSAIIPVSQEGAIESKDGEEPGVSRGKVALSTCKLLTSANTLIIISNEL